MRGKSARYLSAALVIVMTGGLMLSGCSGSGESKKRIKRKDRDRDPSVQAGSSHLL